MDVPAMQKAGLLGETRPTRMMPSGHGDGPVRGSLHADLAQDPPFAPELGPWEVELDLSARLVGSVGEGRVRAVGPSSPEGHAELRQGRPEDTHERKSLSRSLPRSDPGIDPDGGRTIFY
jgi:hypothetical protein